MKDICDYIYSYSYLGYVGFVEDRDSIEDFKANGGVNILYLALTVKKLIEDGEKEICQMTPKRIVNLLKSYKEKISDAKPGKRHLVEVPEQLKSLIGSEVYNEQKKISIIRRINIRFSHRAYNKGISINILLNMIKTFPQDLVITIVQNFDYMKLLIFIGLYARDGHIDEDTIEFIKGSSIEDIFEQYYSEIDSGIETIGNVMGPFVSYSSLYENPNADEIHKSYDKSYREWNLWDIPPEEREQIVSQPYNKDDPPNIKELKEKYRSDLFWTFRMKDDKAYHAWKARFETDGEDISSGEEPAD